jgi:hypothetical protein
MPSFIQHLQTNYTPANIEQYRELLESFEWNLFLTDNYYPSLDSIHRFLFQLTRNGKEWESIYDQICNRKINEYNKKSPEIEEKFIEVEEKVVEKKEKNIRKRNNNKKKTSKKK